MVGGGALTSTLRGLWAVVGCNGGIPWPWGVVPQRQPRGLSLVWTQQLPTRRSPALPTPCLLQAPCDVGARGHPALS